jgi:hypothetical protein
MRISCSGLLTIRVIFCMSAFCLDIYMCVYSHGSSINSNYLMWDLLCVCRVRGMNVCWRVCICPLLMFISTSYFGGINGIHLVMGIYQSGNACYHSVQNLLSSSLLSKNLNIKIYRNIILLVVLYGCETWSLTLREELC